MLNLKIPQQTCTEFEWNVVEVPNFPFQKQNVNKVNLTKSLSHTHTIHSQFDAFNWVFIYQKNHLVCQITFRTNWWCRWQLIFLTRKPIFRGTLLTFTLTRTYNHVHCSHIDCCRVLFAQFDQTNWIPQIDPPICCGCLVCMARARASRRKNDSVRSLRPPLFTIFKSTIHD